MTRTRLIALSTSILMVAGSLTACSALAAATTTASSTVTAASVWDDSAVHEISIDIADADLATVLETYAATQEKVWVSASVTIDGQTFAGAGIKLKGNSSLMGISADSDPATLPWLIRLDKYVDGQNIDGTTELVVRGNNSETALNEAVALELLDLAGLATQEAVSSRFTVNGGQSELRLVIQNPNDEWDAQEFGETGLLYKAEAGGDYSYRGDDPASYTDVFDQEAGDDDLEPLIDFLRFINESDDATFVAELGDYLDIDSFATYLAFQQFVDNFDDIDGPGNNSYLHYDPSTGLMTVVNWDLNLAFGVQNGGGGAQGGGMPGAGRPGGALPDLPEGQLPELPEGGIPEGGMPADGIPAGGMPGGGNILAERFTELFPDLVSAASANLAETLVDSGAAEEVVARWAGVLAAQASDLVPVATIEEEAAAITAQLG